MARVERERRAMVDRRLDTRVDRRFPRNSAKDLYSRIEEKRLALRADRRRQLRRQGDQSQLMGHSDSAIGEMLTQFGERACLDRRSE